MRPSFIARAAIGALCVATPGLSGAPPPLAPTHEAARQNAIPIFNAVHAALRQWGSSLQHNGLSLIPATVPRGTLLYHGTHRNHTAGPPPGPEWLAFEIEHAETFAFSLRYNDSDASKDDGLPAWDDNNGSGQFVLGALPGRAAAAASEKAIRGYLHTYQARRDLKLLYIDGMAAGNSDYGMLDTQDLILRSLQNASAPAVVWDDRRRAADLCRLVAPWGYDGLLRMEIGFEIIHCADFASASGSSDSSDSLDLVSLVRRPFFEQREGCSDPSRMIFRFVRAVAQDYEGLGAPRVVLDFSRMVSAYFYPVNLTNPNPDPSAGALPRLLATTPEERESIRARVIEVNTQTPSSSSVPPIYWQAIVDRVVSRYGDRLALMSAPTVEDSQLVEEVFSVTNTHFEFPETSQDVNSREGQAEEQEEEEQEARRRCIGHHLQPVKQLSNTFTQEDELIYTAIRAVTTRICETLFEARSLLQTVPHSEAAEQPSIRQVREQITELVEDLQWSNWKKCGGCAVNEVCFVAMWPYGRPVDHHRPHCVNATVFAQPMEDNYWFPGGIPWGADRANFAGLY